MLTVTTTIRSSRYIVVEDEDEDEREHAEETGENGKANR